MTIEDDIAFFEQVPSLGLLGRPALRILAIGTESRYVQSGAVLFNAGEPAESGFLIQDGRFRLLPQGSSGIDAVTVGPGTLLGELALLVETRRPATATAIEPATVLCIPRPVFLKTLEGYPDAARRLRDAMAKRSHVWGDDIEQIRTALGAHSKKPN
jgi:CRP-like cAMP-binding protein